MIIKIIPEGDIEKRKIKAVEHKGVKEFFIFGNKKEEDGDLIDFHDWNAGFRYLIGSLSYFNTMIENEMTSKSKGDTNEISLKPQSAQNIVPFIKRGSPKENKIEPVVLAENVNETVIPQPSVVIEDGKFVEISSKPNIQDERDDIRIEVVNEDNDQAGEDK